MKEVATVAGVNPGLVHRYVGNKDDLVRAAAAWASQEAAQVSEPLRGDDRIANYMRLLAHLTLEGYDLADLDIDFPLTHRMNELMESAGFDYRDARIRTVCCLALTSWRILEPLISRAIELDDEDREAVGDALAQTRAWLMTP